LVVNFTREEKTMIFRGLMETIPAFRSKIRIFSPLCSLLSLKRQYAGDKLAPFSCRGGIDFFFIDAANGDTFPCGYRGNENLGKFWNLDPGGIPGGQQCRQCDWECFRDPSEIFGPFLQGITNPFGLIKELTGDRELLRLWINDLLYYRACDYFNGRMPINEKKLKRFAAKPAVESVPLLQNPHLQRSNEPVV
jgi:hypothetical protein